MKTKRNLPMAALLVALTALIIFIARTAKAQDEPPPQHDPMSFAMVGITAGQTMRINVSNVVAINDADWPPGPSRVAIIVINSHGDPYRFRDGSPVRKVVMLERGDSAFLDLNADDIHWPPGPTRMQLRAMVKVEPPPGGDSTEVPPPIGDRFVTSVEVFNNASGRTVFVMFAAPSAQRLFPPGPSD